MVNVWRPSEQHKQYMNGTAFLEARFGVQAVEDLMVDDIVGVARLIMMPAFEGESIFTLVYRRAGLLLHSAVATQSLWTSLPDGAWTCPLQTTQTLVFDLLPPLFRDWSQLKDAARAATTVDYAVINGREYVTEDGVSFHHRILDRDDRIEAEWINPTPQATNHVAQCKLLDAYLTILPHSL